MVLWRSHAGLADMYHDNMRGLVEKYAGAVKAKSPERVSETSKEIQASSKKIRELAQGQA